MTRKNLLIFTSIAGFLLVSCGNGGSGQPSGGADDADAVRTQAVSTYIAGMTETLAARPEASVTPTSLPSFTPAPATETPNNPKTENSCYDLLFLSDKTIPDGTFMKPNEVFTKTWLVQNNGGCAWAPGFTFSNVGGDSMQGEIITLKEPIPVGAKRELSIQLVVPSGKIGLIQSSWRMANADGNFFGDTLSVNINVGGVTTPAFTATP